MCIDPKNRFDFLEKISEKIDADTEKEAVALIWSEMAAVRLHLGQLEETKELTGDRNHSPLRGSHRSR